MPNNGTSLLSPEGFTMLSIALLLDILSIICLILIVALGVGLVLGRVVYISGLIIIGGWQLFRSGNTPLSRNERKKIATTIAKTFFKKHWKKLAIKAVPIIGDLLPLWTWTVYSELKNN